MDIIEVLRSAIEAIKINKLRSVLTALGVIIGVSAVILLISISSGLQNYISSQFEKLGSNSIFVIPGKFRFTGGGPPRAINKLTFNLVDRLERQRDGLITEVLPIIQVDVTARYRNNSKITTMFGTKSSYFESAGLKPKVGRTFTERDNQAASRVTVIGASLTRDLFGGQESIGKTIEVSNKSFTVIGELEPQGNVGGFNLDDLVILPVNTARGLTSTNQLNSIIVRTTSTQTLPAAKKLVEKTLLKSLSEDDFSILTQEQLLSTVLQIIGVLTAALGGIAAISLIVGGVGISNIMLVSVTERTREIGLRKALGAKPADILYQFLAEAIILSFLGGAIGVLAGFLGSLVLSNFLQTHVPLWAVLLGFGFSTLVGVIFGVAPAIRAARLTPIEALRHE